MIKMLVIFSLFIASGFAMIAITAHFDNEAKQSSAVTCVNRGGVPVSTVLVSKGGWILHDTLIVCIKPEAVLR